MDDDELPVENWHIEPWKKSFLRVTELNWTGLDCISGLRPQVSVK